MCGYPLRNRIPICRKPNGQYAESRGWEYVVYRDKGQSGAKNDRPALNSMLNDLRRRKFDVVVVWALDRLARSLKQLLTIGEECRSLGVDLVSLRQNIDTTLPAGRLMFQILGSIAEFERELLRERVRAGMAQARRTGKHVGRPALRKFHLADIQRMRQARSEGASVRKLAADFVLWEKGQIKIRQTYVHNIVQDGAKTKLSKSSVEMHSLLAAVLQKWHEQTPYGNPQDYVFASTKLAGRKPRIGSMIVEDYLRPAAIRAEVISVSEDGHVRDKEGNVVRRFAFHTFRHSLASILMAGGENPAVIQATLRHTSLDMTMYYSHARKQQTRDAQGMVLEAIMPKRGQERGLETVQ